MTRIGESDDILHARKAGGSITTDTYSYIYSGDDDLLQSLSDRIGVIRKFTKADRSIIDNTYLTTNETMVRKFSGVDSFTFLFFRAITGDKSDNLPGIPRFPRLMAKNMAMLSTKFDDLFSLGEPNNKYIQLLRGEYRDTVTLNYNMMKLTSDIDVPIFRKRVNFSTVSKIISDYKLRQFILENNCESRTSWIETL